MWLVVPGKNTSKFTIIYSLFTNMGEIRITHSTKKKRVYPLKCGLNALSPLCPPQRTDPYLKTHIRWNKNNPSNFQHKAISSSSAVCCSLLIAVTLFTTCPDARMDDRWQRHGTRRGIIGFWGSLLSGVKQKRSRWLLEDELNVQ